MVLAIHANQALTLLGDGATALERKTLSCFKTSRNVCYLHSDESVGPNANPLRVLIFHSILITDIYYN
ncbi:hypothetical protein F5Y05DRAFT_400951 [Hypoxylon sp. FL0543]|nr:hypothetical protein F5Y05DRAFT_400951 [Hypoxylon sp. FL0543]